MQELLDISSCAPALLCLAEVYTDQMLMSLKAGEQGAAKDIFQLARKCFKGLEICDPVRRLYWRHRKAMLYRQLGSHV